jgi:tripartite-type tricarboxylate transporter receptor subunit TctC
MRLNIINRATSAQLPSTDLPAPRHCPEFRRSASPYYEAVGWLGIVASKNTPASVVDALNNAINAGLADPKVRQTIANWGEDAFIVSPAAFGKFIVNENVKWGKLILEAGIKLE